MINWILGGLIIGAAAYIILKKIKKMKSGDFTCEGCKGGTCKGCQSESNEKKEKPGN